MRGIYQNYDERLGSTNFFNHKNKMKLSWYNGTTGLDPLDFSIKNAVNLIKHDEVKPKIILSDVGMVTETDVNLAKASNAVLIAFNVKPSKEAKKLAENEKIKISSYNIIYEVLDYIKKRMSGLLTPDIKAVSYTHLTLPTTPYV